MNWIDLDPGQLKTVGLQILQAPLQCVENCYEDIWWSFFAKIVNG